MSEKIILGIDPGTVVLGYGIIRVKKQQLEYIHCDVIKLGKDEEHTLRLKVIFETLSKVMEEHAPDELAIEAPFFGKNVQSMLKLGRAQGVAMAAALSRGMPVCEYSPRKIKQSITGNGNASKEQLAAMIQRLLNLKELPKYFDSSDALGVAVCHHFQSKAIDTGGKRMSGWKAFIAENPGRKL
ncbi:MAG: crossover junction endodeoxyribonuclease RuvC [Bacteroidetes bacterium]|jgi:crossover junction endodeoxyribonuclease RuvC|nr:crossover junction endodeoxyribonuclease RuvC [Bacteroidota bacterium]